ncbi:MAG: HAD-superfamily hydrolase, subfamily variant 3 [Frankiales bacterium]|nr:HAD-superfamily hydrolase, subfamily variant 3 [Frankiales bacterium]
MRLTNLDGVLFDVDGTLVDTTYIHAVCWSEALAAVGRHRVTADLHHLVGMDGELLLDTVLSDAPPAESLRAELKERHATLYRSYWPGLRPMPGARNLLEHLHDSGLRVVLASSASGEELDALQKALDADQWIDAATSSEDTDAGKPAPDIVLTALAKGDLSADRAVFVGDAIWDGRAAERAGVPFVGLSCGGTPAVDLKGAGAGEVFDTPGHLLAHIGGLSA